MEEDKKVFECTKCHRKLNEHNFFRYKNKEIMPICKACIASSLDEDEPNTWLDILKELDRPYVEEEWDALREHYPNRPLSNILGRYIAKMNLNGFKDYTYRDGPRLHQRFKESRKESVRGKIGVKNLSGPKDIIVLRYNIEETPYEAAVYIHDAAVNLFPDNKVISLPDNYSLEVMTEEEVAEMIEHFEKYLETGQN